MSETLYQNIDAVANNPLHFGQETSSPENPKPKKSLSPKIIILIILGIIILLLLIASLIVTSTRKIKIQSTTEQPSPTPLETQIPTTPASLLPEKYTEKFKSIENNLSNDLDIKAPEIDIEVGL